MSFKKDLDRLSKDLDVKKYFPKGYFNLWVFRIAFINLLLFFLVILFVYGDTTFINVNCPAGGPVCQNPFYICSEEDKIFIAGDFKYTFNSDCIQPLEAPKEALAFCDKYDLCDKVTIEPGSSFGEPPPYYVKNFTKMIFLILFMAFAVNHAFYIQRREKWRR